MAKNPFKDWTPAMVEHFNARGSQKAITSTLTSNQPQTAVKPVKTPRRPAYTTEQVIRWCEENHLPSPAFEHRFHETRLWRMDVAWIKEKVFLECQGGIWVQGGHSRGAQMKKDWDKWMAAQILGWRVAWCEPKELLTTQTAQTILQLITS